MENVFNYIQKKQTEKGRCDEKCSIDIFHQHDRLIIDLSYHFTYLKSPVEPTPDSIKRESLREVKSQYRITIDLLKPNFFVFSSTINSGFLSDEKKSKNRELKNNFRQLAEIIDLGFYGGGKKGTSWGVRYEKKTKSAWEVIKNIIQPSIKDPYLKTKNYNTPTISPLYDLISDFYIDSKKVKGHDLIYLDIQEDFPKEKFLKVNDRKFVPSLLDQYGIKTKQFIGALNNSVDDMPIIIKSLNYLCKLFGENYIDYMNKIDWHLHCYKSPPTKKTHTLKNEREKKNMVKLIQNWEEEGLRTNTEISMDGSVITSIYNLLELRNKVEDKGIELKFTATSDSELDIIYEEWISLKKYLIKGYRVRYNFPTDFVDYIEKPIVIGNVVYTPLILKTEESFKIEGHIMKNCMGGQFDHGSISIYVSLRKGKKWVDVQFRSGDRTMCYGKANSDTPSDFKIAIDSLTKRMKKFKDIKWSKEKYDII